MEVRVSEQEYQIPPQLTTLHGCKTAEPLIYEVSMSLVELFVPGSRTTKLPLRLVVRPKNNGHPAHRDFPIPMTFGLDPAIVRKNRKGLQRGNPFKLVLESDSFAYGIEQWLRESLFPHLSLHIFFFPKGYMLGKEDRWRIELHYHGDVIGQWNGEPASLGRHPLLIGTGSPVC